MKKNTQVVLIGVGVLAVVGLAFYFFRNKNKEATPSSTSDTTQAPQQGGVAAIAQAASSLFSKDPEIARQKLENKRLKGATRQAKLMKKGKITIEDLQKIQNVKQV